MGAWLSMCCCVSLSADVCGCVVPFGTQLRASAVAREACIISQISARVAQCALACRGDRQARSGLGRADPRWTRQVYRMTMQQRNGRLWLGRLCEGPGEEGAF